jgi:serine/threonine-protein kinase RsbT
MKDIQRSNGTAASSLDELCVVVRSADDVVRARGAARSLGTKLGFGVAEITLITTVVSELARNILRYAGRGEVLVAPTADGDRLGIVVVARDRGPGIAEVNRALEIGWSTSGGLGLGLPGVRRLVHDFEIESRVGVGTTVTVKRWLH